MPLPTLFEAQDSRDDLTYGVSGGSVTVRYFSYGSDDEVDHYDAALLVAPEVYLGFIRQDISPKRVGPKLYKTDVKYGTVGQGGSEQPAGNTPAANTEPGNQGSSGGADNEPLGPGYSFDTSGETVHITQSIATVSATHRGGGDSPDFKHAIGVSGDNKIEGVDIFGPKLDWERTVLRNECTLGYVKKLMRLTRTHNTAPFYGFGIRDVLYLGASGKQTENNKWSITHKFSVIETQNDIEICEDLTVPQKRGWEYLWVLYEPDVLPGQVAPRPIDAFVEQVYKDGDFSLLEITA